MGSGLMGSYAAAASVDSDNDAGVRILRNRRDEGRWLVLLETPNGIEAPWQVIQKVAAAAGGSPRRPVMLPREELLAGAQNPEGLTVLVDLAEQVLRTWQPAWSPFLSAPLREEALARLGSLSELTWISDGGYPGAERQRLLCHRRDDSPDPAAPVQGLLIEGNFLFDPFPPRTCAKR